VPIYPLYSFSPGIGVAGLLGAAPQAIGLPGPPPVALSAGSAVFEDSGSIQVQPPKVRKEFPEAWIWESIDDIGFVFQLWTIIMGILLSLLLFPEINKQNYNDNYYYYAMLKMNYYLS